jgi:CheY-like chemotaxis protein
MKKLNKILLIDDDKVTNFLNKDLIEGLNIAKEVQVIEDGGEAFEYLAGCTGNFQNPCPEFVIFDHQMPCMDGMELIESLYNTGFMKDGKVIFMYLNVDSKQQDIDALKELGVQEFTTKPLSQEKVMEVYHKYWQNDTQVGWR